MNKLNINSEFLLNVISQLNDNIEDNPFNYDINVETKAILMREVASRGLKVRQLTTELKDLKNIFYKTKQTNDERTETYTKIQEISRQIKEM